MAAAETSSGNSAHQVLLNALQVIRQYHGHLSGIYALALHPTLDVLISGGRDSVARVWDMRTKVQVGLYAGLPLSRLTVALHAADAAVDDQQHALWQAALQIAEPRLQTDWRSAVGEEASQCRPIHPADNGTHSATVERTCADVSPRSSRNAECVCRHA